jgi:hypothetical protein
MNVNISRERVRVLRFRSAQPEDARHDWVAPWRIRHNDFTSSSSIFENRARRRGVTYLLGDLQFAQWRKTAAAPIA